MYRFKIFSVLVLFFGISNVFGQGISARITPVISVNNDSLYLDFEVTRLILTDALGNSDFAFRITDARTSVPGLTSPINLNGFTIKSRGRWDAASDTNYVSMTLDRSVDQSTYILKVRTRTPRIFNGTANSIIPSLYGPAALVARLATKIESGACVDSIKLEWNRNISNANPLGYLTAFRFNLPNSSVSNTFVPISSNNYIKLRPIIVAPSVGAASLPQAVLFTWFFVPNVRQYSARIVKNGRAETTYVQIGNGNVTEYRVQTRPRDTVYFTLYAKSSCSFDSVMSGLAFGDALDCPIITLDAANVSLNKNTAYCPTELVTITVDTAGKNLTKPVRFTYNGGASYVESNTFSFRGTRDTTLRVTFEDGNFCDANNTITVNVPILRLTQAGTAITMNLIDSVCNNGNINLSFTPVGDNLLYTWTTTGLGSFVDANGNTITTPTGTPILYKPAANETGIVRFRAFNACFGIGANDSVKLIATPTAAIAFDPSQAIGGNLPTSTPIRFSRTNPVAGERYDYVFSDGNPSILDTTATTVTRTFNIGGNYTLTLTVRNTAGCIDTAVLRFRVIETFNVYVPNIFSPAANNPVDQTFRINGTGVDENVEVVVFDKWGKEVYNVNSYTKARNEGWNGKKDNTGDLQQTGAYTYVVKGKYLDGNKFEKTGTVTLIR